MPDGFDSSVSVSVGSTAVACLLFESKFGIFDQSEVLFDVIVDEIKPILE